MGLSESWLRWRADRCGTTPSIRCHGSTELWYSYAFEVQFPEAEGDAAAAAAAGAAAQEGAAAAGSGGSKPAAAGKPAKPRAKQLGRGKASKPARSSSGSGGKSGGGSGGKEASGGSSTGGTGGGLASRPSGSSKPVMVPFACHVNHSPWPHCVRCACTGRGWVAVRVCQPVLAPACRQAPTMSPLPTPVWEAGRQRVYLPVAPAAVQVWQGQPRHRHT